MDKSDVLCDIYSLRPQIRSRYLNKTAAGFISDLRNVIFIDCPVAGGSLSTIKDGTEIACSECLNPTIFAYDSSFGSLCPRCYYDHFGEYRSCVLCKRRLGCESCGASSTKMLEICSSRGVSKMVLCAQDKCLMPFGYHVSSRKLVCSCERDACTRIKKHLPGVLHKIFEEFVIDPPSKWIYWKDRSRKLANLTMSDQSKCLPCQLNLKFKEIDQDELHDGSDVVCNC